MVSPALHGMGSKMDGVGICVLFGFRNTFLHKVFVGGLACAKRIGRFYYFRSQQSVWWYDDGYGKDPSFVQAMEGK